MDRRKNKLPFLDIEIGSTSESYNNPVAASVIAYALMDAFASEEKCLLYFIWRSSFEDTITNAVLHKSHPVSLTYSS